VLASYLKSFDGDDIEALILGCTHYPSFTRTAEKLIGAGVDVMGQDTIIPAKLADYLARHPEYANAISQGGATEFLVTDLTDNYKQAAQRLYGADIKIQKTEY